MKTPARGIVVLIATIMIQLTVGLAYIWSAFQNGVADRLFNEQQHLASLTFSLLLASLAISSVFGGKLAAKFSTRIVVIAGGIIAGIGFMVAGLVRPEFSWLLWISYGIFGGAGMGFTYTTTIACTQKWFPHKKGLITGLVVAALGLGTAAFTPLVRYLVNNFHYIIDAFGGDSFISGFGGESFTMMILGGIILVVCVVGGIFMKNPPKDYLKELPLKPIPCFECAPKGEISDNVQRMTGAEINIAQEYLDAKEKQEVVLAIEASDTKGKEAEEGEDCIACEDALVYEKPIVYAWHDSVKKIKRPKPREFVYRNLTASKMIKTPQFWLITIAFMLACIGGLMLIGFADPIAGMHDFGEGIAFVAILAVGISNASGRLLWGAISDKLGRINTIFILLGGTAILAPFLVIPQLGGGVFAIIALIGLCYGGILAIFPSLTAELFGSKNLATNYGLVLLGFGVGAVVASQIGGLFSNPARQYNNMLYMLPAFLIASGTATAAALLLMGVKLLNRATRKKIAGIFLTVVRKIKIPKKGAKDEGRGMREE